MWRHFFSRLLTDLRFAVQAIGFVLAVISALEPIQSRLHSAGAGPWTDSVDRFDVVFWGHPTV